VPAFARDNGPEAGDARFSMDKWDGYTASRQRVFARIKETNASNPIVFSGDVHVHYGADLKMDFANPASETIGVEFTNSSITSGGDGTAVSANWERLRRHNPHLRFHSNRRCHIACTATPDTMRAEYRAVERVTTAGASPSTVGALVVAAAKPGAHTD
jgi:alkaline phosphatase D